MTENNSWDDEYAFEDQDNEYEASGEAPWEKALKLEKERIALRFGFEKYNNGNAYSETIDEYLMYLVNGYINARIRPDVDMHLMELLEDDWFYRWPLIHWCYASRLLRGTGCRKNVKRAVEILLPMAKKGCVPALYDIGCCYMNGWQLDLSPVRALCCWTIASNMGYHEARKAVGLVYEGKIRQRYDMLPIQYQHLFLLEVAEYIIDEYGVDEANVYSERMTPYRKMLLDVQKELKRVDKALEKQMPMIVASNLFGDAIENPYKVEIFDK